MCFLLIFARAGARLVPSCVGPRAPYGRGGDPIPVEFAGRNIDLTAEDDSSNRARSELDWPEREIASRDAEIDELAYELYGVTDEARKLTEES